MASTDANAARGVWPSRLDWLAPTPAGQPEKLWSLLRECGLVVVVYAILHRLLFRFANLDEASYFQPLLLVEVLKTPKLAATLVLPQILLFARWRHLRWSNFDNGGAVRWFVFVVTLTSAWTFATYEYNLYYDQSHTVDRFLLLAFAALVLVHPAFVAPYVVMGAVMVFQSFHPLPGGGWLDKGILFEVLLMFLSFLYLSVLRRQRLTIFVGMTVCLLAANYFVPGLAKVQTSWVRIDKLQNLAVACHLNGWLGFVSRDAFLSTVDQLKWLNPVLVWMTLALELGAILTFARRPFLFLILTLGTMLHIGIFISSGICFWKWVVLNVAAMVLLWRLGRARTAPLWQWRFFAVSAVLVATADLYSNPKWLVWYDTALNEMYEFEVETVDGEVFNVPRTMMAPYELIFAQNRFWYLRETNRLVGTFGATPDEQIYLALERATSLEEVDRLTQEHGTNSYNEQGVEAFDRFAKLFFSTLNERQSKAWLLSKFKSPYHIWSSAKPPRYEMSRPAQRLRVRYVRQLYTGHEVVELENSVIREVSIPATRAQALEELGLAAGEEERAAVEASLSLRPCESMDCEARPRCGPGDLALVAFSQPPLGRVRMPMLY